MKKYASIITWLILAHLAHAEDTLTLEEIQLNLSNKPRVIRTSSTTGRTVTHTNWLIGSKATASFLEIEGKFNKGRELISVYVNSEAESYCSHGDNHYKIKGKHKKSLYVPPSHRYDLTMIRDEKIDTVKDERYYSITGLADEKTIYKWIKESMAPKSDERRLLERIFDKGFVKKYSQKGMNLSQFLSIKEVSPMKINLVYDSRYNSITSISAIAASGELMFGNTVDSTFLDPKTKKPNEPDKYKELKESTFKSEVLKPFLDNSK